MAEEKVRVADNKNEWPNFIVSSTCTTSFGGTGIADGLYTRANPVLSSRSISNPLSVANLGEGPGFGLKNKGETGMAEAPRYFVVHEEKQVERAPHLPEGADRTLLIYNPNLRQCKLLVGCPYSRHLMYVS